MASPRQRHRNASIEQPRILLVEGTDDYWFFQRLIEHRQSSNVQVIEFGGKDRLGDFLANALVPDPKFSEMVEVLGVVRDADRNYESALQSVQDSLRRARLPVPTVPLTYVEGDVQGEAIRVVAYIMPDNRSSGDLEKLCLAAVTDAQAMTCVDRYIDCLKSNGLIRNMSAKPSCARSWRQTQMIQLCCRDKRFWLMLYRGTAQLLTASINSWICSMPSLAGHILSQNTPGPR